MGMRFLLCWRDSELGFSRAPLQSTTEKKKIEKGETERRRGVGGFLPDSVGTKPLGRPIDTHP